MTPFTVVIITAPQGAIAEEIANALLKKRLAACVNVAPLVESYFWWKGKLDRSSEALLIVKTRKSLVKRLIAFVKSIHPYDVPEIISLPIADGFKPYLQWLKKETQ